MRRWLSACLVAAAVAGFAGGIAQAQSAGAASQAPAQAPPSGPPAPQNTGGGNATAQSPAQNGASSAQIVQPRLVHLVKPLYPDALIQARFSGAALVSFTIAKDGTVRDVKAVTTNHFSEISVAAVQQWTFEPMQEGGEAVDSDAQARIVFTVEFVPGTNHANSSAVEIADNGAATAKPSVPENSEPVVPPVSTQPAPSTEVTEAKLLHSVSPSYHVDAEDTSKGGTVVLNFKIQADGTVSDAQFVSGPAEYKDAAIAAVQQWTYDPARVGGRAVVTDGSASFVFKGAPQTSDGVGNAATASGPASPQRVKVAGNVIAKKLVHQVQPVYPQQARTAREQGTVVLHAIIGTDGTVKTLTPVSGPEHLVAPAMDAVKQWRYKPTLIDGQPVEVDTTVSVIFNLF